MSSERGACAVVVTVPGVTRGGEIACWRATSRLPTISAAPIVGRTRLLERRSSGSRPTNVARARTSGRSRSPTAAGIETNPDRRQPSRWRASPVAGRSGVASTARSSSIAGVASAVERPRSSTSMVPSRSRSPKRSCRAAYSASSSSVMPTTSATTTEPGASSGSGPEMSSRRSIATGLDAARVAEAVEVAAVRHEVELDPGALQLGEHRRTDGRWRRRHATGRPRRRRRRLRRRWPRRAGRAAGDRRVAPRPRRRRPTPPGSAATRRGRDDDHGDAERAAPGAAAATRRATPRRRSAASTRRRRRRSTTKAASDHAQ